MNDEIVWGAFTGEYADPETAAGARQVALPMALNTPLKALRDSIGSAGALDRLRLDVLGLPINLDAYVEIMGALGIGGYRAEELANSDAVNYGEEHFTCFQFDYDWRRDNVENARRLHHFIDQKRAYVQREYEKRFGVENYDVKFDIVAHSMGGLLTRYYHRYGTQDLPKDRTPEPTWEGAAHVDRVVLVGTPNAGSAKALLELVNGKSFSCFVPEYVPAILGTMPATYQLLPRDRHGALVDATAPADTIRRIFDPEFWQEMEWGLADPDQQDILTRLLPNVEDPAEQRRIAMDHLEKSLDRARRFHRALDTPAETPGTLEVTLIAGDARAMLSAVQVDRETGTLTKYAEAPGDGTVTRSSALMDERLAGPWAPTLISPIDWDHVTFLFADHVEMTQDPTFTDNLLFYLLESPY